MTRTLFLVSLALVAAIFPAPNLAAPSGGAPSVVVRNSDYGRILFDGDAGSAPRAARSGAPR